MMHYAIDSGDLKLVQHYFENFPKSTTNKKKLEAIKSVLLGCKPKHCSEFIKDYF